MPHSRAQLDPELGRQLLWLLAHPVAGLDLNFRHAFDVRGRRYEENLDPPPPGDDADGFAVGSSVGGLDDDGGGRAREVTDANKGEYVRLLAAARATRPARRRMRALREGFHAALPAEARAVLRAEDLAAVRIASEYT